MKRSWFLVLLILCSAACQEGHADTFEYSFHFGEGFGYAPYFTYDSPALIRSDTKFVPLACGGGPSACIGAEINPGCEPGELPPKCAYYEIYFDPATTVSFGDEFVDTLPPDFFEVGTHALGGITLSITDISSTAAAPEPSSLVLLGSGLLGAVELGRRRFRVRNP